MRRRTAPGWPLVLAFCASLLLHGAGVALLERLLRDSPVPLPRAVRVHLVPEAPSEAPEAPPAPSPPRAPPGARRAVPTRSPAARKQPAPASSGAPPRPANVPAFVPAPEAPPLPAPETGTASGEASATPAPPKTAAVARAPDPTRVFGSGEVDSVARAVERPAPAYPARARRLGREAEREVMATVGRDGRVLDAIVQGPRDDDFDREAAAGVRRWRFEPARRDGHVVTSRVRVRIRFRLEP